MALPVMRTLSHKYYQALVTSQTITAAVIAAVVGNGVLVQVRATQAGATTVDAAISVLVNGVTATSGTMTQTASGSVTGTSHVINPAPTPVADGDFLEFRRNALGGTATTGLAVTFVVKETTIGG